MILFFALGLAWTDVSQVDFPEAMVPGGELPDHVQMLSQSPRSGMPEWTQQQGTEQYTEGDRVYQLGTHWGPGTATMNMQQACQNALATLSMSVSVSISVTERGTFESDSSGEESRSLYRQIALEATNRLPNVRREEAWRMLRFRNHEDRLTYRTEAFCRVSIEKRLLAEATAAAAAGQEIELDADRLESALDEVPATSGTGTPLDPNLTWQDAREASVASQREQLNDIILSVRDLYPPVATPDPEEVSDMLELPESTLDAFGVTVASFYAMPTPVTNALFVQFLNSFEQTRESPSTWFFQRENGCIRKSFNTWFVPNDCADEIASNVTWVGAQRYCQWLGRRLPNEHEWDVLAVHPDFVDAIGTDLQAGAWREWTLGAPVSDQYPSVIENPGYHEGNRVVRGFSDLTESYTSPAYHQRRALYSTNAAEDVVFRCVKDK